MKASKSLPYGWVVLTLLVFSLAGWVPPAGRAEDVRDTSSLKFVPEDVAFYSTSLRLREQYEAFAGSKAFAAIRNMPAVQAGVGFLRLMWEGGQYEQAAAVKAFLEQEENKPLIEMLGDACSHEIFLFGGKGYGGLVRLVNEVNRVQRQAQITALREGGEAERIMAELLLETLTKSLDNAKLPDTVVGFRISDAQRAKDQLARLETLLKELLARTPELQPFQDRLTRETVAGAEYLTLKLDGGLIPWDKVYEEVEDQRAKLEQLAAKIKPMTLVVQIGVWNDYLLISLGDSSEHLAALGHGPRLADRKEFKPLAKYADRPIVSIGYADEGFMREAGAVSQQVDELVGLAEQLLPLAQLDDSVEQELMQDVRAMTESIKKHIPQPGAQFGVSFLTPRGYEGFGYNWAENPLIDASQKLSILRHVGSNPIFLFATRSKYDPKCYDGVATCVARAVYYAEKIGLPKLPDADRAKYEKLRDQLLPLVKKMDQVTREVLVPAMQDGQMAVVLDAQSTSTQWHQDMPLSQQPLPMLELAVLYGVSDKEAVKKAGGSTSRSCSRCSTSCTPRSRRKCPR